MEQGSERVEQSSSSEAKIALFRSLFRGRDDVYARRFESRKTGKSGYAPACENEWVRGICEKPRIKYAECPNRRFLPVTDDVIRWHLRGQDGSGQPFVAGVYPMLLDETCFFLAVATSIKPAGSTMRRHSWRHPAGWVSRLHWSDRGLAAAGMCGCSSMRPCLPRLRESSARTF